MARKEFAKECALVASIIADCIFKKLYVACQKQGGGYMMCADTISEWALEFTQKHECTNWEEILEIGINPLSKEIGTIICFDDAVVDFGFYKLAEFNK